MRESPFKEFVHQIAEFKFIRTISSNFTGSAQLILASQYVENLFDRIFPKI
jgi:hypothetical protein